jgi:mercuric ion transport protein
MSHTWKRSLVALPAVSVSLLPKLACPLCWPAYAGLLSSVGLGFIISTKYLLPLTATFLVLALAALVFRAKNRHGCGPFALGVFSAVGILLGKFEWGLNPALYGAVGLLAIASLWNAWPHPVSTAACRAEKSIN